METVQILNMILLIVVAIIGFLGLAAIIIILKLRTQKTNKDEISTGESKTEEEKPTLITRDGKEINSIYKFMEFDQIVDNMIVRKNRKQFAMVIQCKGINYDLLSAEEKNAVEQGFIEMLNTLRNPVQLYVQSRALDLTNLIREYEQKSNEIKDQISKINVEIQKARNSGNTEDLRRLLFEKKRKENILEYGESIEDYTRRIDANRNILQQKTYIIISCYAAEFGDTSKYSKEEINDLAFSELYTRAQTVIRALGAAEVTGKVLDSEGLAELLYMAYNRDEAETYTLQNALDAQYDRLYSTARNVMEEKKKRIEKQIEEEALKLTTNSIIKADEINRQEKARRVKAKAKEILEDYKDELSVPLYKETQRQIEQADVEQATKSVPRRAVRRKIQ